MAREEYMVVDVVDILRRLQNGYLIRAVARATGMDRTSWGHVLDYHLL